MCMATLMCVCELNDYSARHTYMKALTMVAIYTAYVHITELMIMGEHQTFSSQTNHLSGQVKFGCTYYIIIYTVYSPEIIRC